MEFDSDVYMWIAIVVGFAILEVVTMAFVAIYFAFGAAAAGVAAAFGLGMQWQLLAFSVGAIVMLVLTRPVLKRRLESPDIPTNVDLMVGKGGIVTIPIDNDANTGQVRIGTEYWTARAADGVDRIPADARVTIESIEGVTARVARRADAPTGEA